MANFTLQLDFQAGVNLLADERRLNDKECVKLQNLIPVAPGILGKRKGTTGLVRTSSFLGGAAAFSFTDASALHVQCGAVINDSTLPKFIVCGRYVVTTGSNNGPAAAVHVIDAAGNKITSRTWKYIPQRNPCITYFNGKVYITQGYGALSSPSGTVASARPNPIIVLQLKEGANTAVSSAVDTASTTDVELNNFAFDDNDLLTPAVSTVYRERMVWGDFGPGYENYLVMSDDADPATIGADVLAANGRALQIGATGERITALVDVMLAEAGTPAQSALLVLKENSTYLLTGELDQADGGGTDNLEVVRLSLEAGCVGWNAVARTPFGIYWVGPDDVWFMRAGALPERVGRKISPWLQGTPAEHRYRVHAVFHNGFLRVALNTQGHNTDSTDDGAPLAEQYWMDLREGAPPDWANARWYGPQIHKMPLLANTASTQGAFAMFRDIAADTLYGACADPANGYLYLYGFDAQQGYDEVAPLSSFDIDDQWDNEIAFDIRTKNFDFGDPHIDKLALRTELDVLTNLPVKLVEAFYLNGGVSGTAGDNTFLSSSGGIIQTVRSGFVVGADALDSTYLTREFQQIIGYPSAGARVKARQFQFSLTDSPGYIIDSTNDELIVYTYYNGGNQSTVTLTQGFYATLAALCSHVASLINVLRVASFFGSTSGAVTTSVSAQSHGVVTFTIPSAVDNWGFVFSADSGGVTTAATKRKSRIVGAQLGFNTAANCESATATITAGSHTRWKESSRIEIGNLNLYFRSLTRRPH